jgi:hypothetical protein
MRFVEHIAGMKDLRNIYMALVGKLKETPLKGPRCRWNNNIKFDLKEMGLEEEDWIHLALYQ